MLAQCWHSSILMSLAAYRVASIRRGVSCTQDYCSKDFLEGGLGRDGRAITSSKISAQCRILFFRLNGNRFFRNLYSTIFIICFIAPLHRYSSQIKFRALFHVFFPLPSYWIGCVWVCVCMYYFWPLKPSVCYWCYGVDFIIETTV
jgi:hypothetical protein